MRMLKEPTRWEDLAPGQKAQVHISEDPMVTDISIKKLDGK